MTEKLDTEREKKIWDYTARLNTTYASAKKILELDERIAALEANSHEHDTVPKNNRSP